MDFYESHVGLLGRRPSRFCKKGKRKRKIRFRKREKSVTATLSPEFLAEAHYLRAWRSKISIFETHCCSRDSWRSFKRQSDSFEKCE